MSHRFGSGLSLISSKVKKLKGLTLRCSSDFWSLPDVRAASRLVAESVGVSAGVKNVSNSSVQAMSCSSASAASTSSQPSSAGNCVANS